ncbi:hypothetical protein [Lysinibacillus sp. ZYM-1]|uniref:hypothetical protein n=1 Tax=Lysinibacillus sp. ZYM-1 TaxID=1681184 RepID=UPI0006CE7FE1|nr:hypothetical protein [Lysinibacillus sp. ZYM-1]KPN94960.1 hypothetical protein AO843_22170 [Lysinibacillus sp. ZYM-1]
MTISHKEFDRFWNEYLIEFEIKNKEFTQIQKETLEIVEKIISNPSLYRKGIVNEAIKLKESLMR